MLATFKATFETNRNQSRLRVVSLAALALCISFAGGVPVAHAERIENQVAVFSALDKVTARISKFEVEINKTVAFGQIKVTPRVCYSRPATELPKTTTFVEVDETQLDGTEKRIFTGWMFAESPGIFGVEHPTVDVWLTECKNPIRSTPQQASPQPSGDDSGAAATASGDGWPPSDQSADVPRRRVRR